jgi:RNA polymerase sigma-70 factor (ECF subfamily)
LLRLVQAVLKQLPAGQAIVLALTIDGYSAREIAVMLDYQENTVRSNLRHARKAMAAALKGGGWNG